MSENMTDIHFATIEMDGRDQPGFVTADVENDPGIEFIGGRKDLSQFGETFEFGFLHDLEPTHERCLAVGIFLPKPDQRFAGDDVHASSISQFEIEDKAYFGRPGRHRLLPGGQ
jgi:hypothetical protein